jgi:PEP-CTERM motif
MEMVMRALTYVAAVALLVGIATSQPASAAVIANGSFTFDPTVGAVTVNTGDITLLTASKTEPPLAVTAVDGNIGLAFSAGATVTLAPNPVPIAPDLSTVPVNITMTIAGQVVTFTSETTLNRQATTSTIPGSFSEKYSGTLTSSAGAIFVTGAPVTWSEACTQASNGALIDCADSVIAIGAAVPEPASLALLGGALLGFSVLRRRKRA